MSNYIVSEEKGLYIVKYMAEDREIALEKFTSEQEALDYLGILKGDSSHE